MRGNKDRSGRSQLDLARWGIELTRQHTREVGFHLVVWMHDDTCALNPSTRSPTAASRCCCEPDAQLVLHYGTENERCIPVVLDGIPVGIAPAQSA